MFINSTTLQRKPTQLPHQSDKLLFILSIVASFIEKYSANLLFWYRGLQAPNSQNIIQKWMSSSTVPCQSGNPRGSDSRLEAALEVRSTTKSLFTALTSFLFHLSYGPWPPKPLSLGTEIIRNINELETFHPLTLMTSCLTKVLTQCQNIDFPYKFLYSSINIYKFNEQSQDFLARMFLAALMSAFTSPVHPQSNIFPLRFPKAPQFEHI